MVARDGDDGRAEPAQQRGGPLVLLAPAAVGQVAARDDEVGLQPLDERAERTRDVGALVAADVQVRDVENPCCHLRPSL